MVNYLMKILFRLSLLASAAFFAALCSGITLAEKVTSPVVQTEAGSGTIPYWPVVVASVKGNTIARIPRPFPSGDLDDSRRVEIFKWNERERMYSAFNSCPLSLRYLLSESFWVDDDGLVAGLTFDDDSEQFFFILDCNDKSVTKIGLEVVVGWEKVDGVYFNEGTIEFTDDSGAEVVIQYK